MGLGPVPHRPPGGLAASRRDVVLHGVAVVGLVWVAPAVRSVGLGAPVGSPPPSSSTTTPGFTEHTFAGAVPRVRHEFDSGPSQSDPACFSDDVLLEFTTDLGPLGVGDVSMSYCTSFDTFTEFVVRGGSFSIATPDGTVGGGVSGELIRLTAGPSAPFQVHLELSITDGTGAYTGAAGSGVLDGPTETEVVIPDDDDLPTVLRRWITGEISGSFTVP